MKRSVWGAGEQKRSIHWVSWEVLCSPKKMGGVGLKKAEIMNMAFLAKLCWRVFSNRDGVWCRLIPVKYRMRGEDD